MKSNLLATESTQAVMTTLKIAAVTIVISASVTTLAAKAKEEVKAAKPAASVVPSALEVKASEDQGQVSFEAVGKPSMLKIKGVGKGVDGGLVVADKKATGELVFKVDTLDTSIGLRNEHMKEKYLEVNKFPTATLKVTELKLPDSWTPENPKTDKIPFKGDLTLHGVTKPVEGLVQVLDNNLKSEATFSVVLTDHGIAIPSYLGVTVAEKVNVQVSLNQLSTKKSVP